MINDSVEKKKKCLPVKNCIHARAYLNLATEFIHEYLTHISPRVF